MKIIENFIDHSVYTRPGYNLTKVSTLVIHYTGRAEVDYKHWINYYKERSNSEGLLGYGSCHLFAENDGNVYNLIPLHEVAWHVGSRTYTRYAIKRFDMNKTNYLERYEQPNYYSIGLELRAMNNFSCEFSDDMFSLGVQTSAYICEKFGLDPLTDIVTHNMITGKKCPFWFVEHPEDFIAFKESVKKALGG